MSAEDAALLPVAGMAALAGRFDAWLVDVWGVLMDGAHPYQGAADCLERLRGRGKRIVLVSNAPRRGGRVGERLAEIGIAPGLYDHVASSGEASRLALVARKAPPFDRLGRRYHYIGPERDADLLEGTEYRRTTGL